MQTRKMIVAAVAAVVLLAAAGAMADTFGAGGNQFSLSFVPISGATNPSSGYGIVNHDYRMGTYDITNDQWNKFLAAYGTVTGSDGGYSYTSYWTGANVPVNEVSWFEAAQFVNWLNTSTNHQAAYKFTGEQATGNYTLATWSAGEAANNGTDLYRNKDAFYYLPTEDEWVKAAYWNGTSLQTYAMKDGAVPVVGVDSNCDRVIGQPWNVGSGSQELNGTYDMMGNVWQWEESPYTSGDYGTGSVRGLRGGSYVSAAYGLASSFRYGDNPGNVDTDFGFRVASQVPEPCSLALLTMGGLALLRRRK